MDPSALPQYQTPLERTHALGNTVNCTIGDPSKRKWCTRTQSCALSLVLCHNTKHLLKWNEHSVGTIVEVCTAKVDFFTSVGWLSPYVHTHISIRSHLSAGTITCSALSWIDSPCHKTLNRVRSNHHWISRQGKCWGLGKTHSAKPLKQQKACQLLWCASEREPFCQPTCILSLWRYTCISLPPNTRKSLRVVHV